MTYKLRIEDLGNPVACIGVEAANRPYAEEEFPLEGGVTRIGRVDGYNGLIDVREGFVGLGDPSVSRDDGEFRVDDEGVRYRNNGSNNRFIGKRKGRYFRQEHVTDAEMIPSGAETDFPMYHCLYLGSMSSMTLMDPRFRITLLPEE